MKKQIALTQKQLAELPPKYGKKNVELAIAAIQSKNQKERQKRVLNDFTPVAPVDATGEPLSQTLEDQAKEVMALRSRLAMLKARQVFVKKNGWHRDAAKYSCPEIYLQVMVEQVIFQGLIYLCVCLLA